MSHHQLQIHYLSSKLKHHMPRLGGGRILLKLLSGTLLKSKVLKKSCLRQASPKALAFVKLEQSYLKQESSQLASELWSSSSASSLCACLPYKHFLGCVVEDASLSGHRQHRVEFFGVSEALKHCIGEVSLILKKLSLLAYLRMHARCKQRVCRNC